MNTNLPIGGSDYSSTLKKLSSAAKVEKVDGQIKTVTELKQAHLEGGNLSISDEQLIKAIDRAIKAVEGTSTTLDFSIHEKTKHIIVKVLDRETGQLIREIPREKNLDFIAKVWELAGALVDEKR